MDDIPVVEAQVTLQCVPTVIAATISQRMGLMPALNYVVDDENGGHGIILINPETKEVQILFLPNKLPNISCLLAVGDMVNEGK